MTKLIGVILRSRLHKGSYSSHRRTHLNSVGGTVYGTWILRIRIVVGPMLTPPWINRAAAKAVRGPRSRRQRPREGTVH